MIREKKMLELLMETMKKTGLCTFLTKSEIMNLFNKDINIMPYKKDSYIIKEGISGGMFYILAEGKVSVTKKEPDGKVVILATLKPGDFFGEISLITGATRLTNVIADEDVLVFGVGKDDFFEIFMGNEKIKSIMEMKCNIRKASTSEKLKNKVAKAKVGD